MKMPAEKGAKMNKKHLRVLGLALALALAGLAPVPPLVHASVYSPAYSPAPLSVRPFLLSSASTCTHDNYDDVWTYYSDATMKTAVGRCENDCGLYCHCWGTQTQWFTVVSSRNC
jgi:hypothetical protein